GRSWPGEHAPIVDAETFAQVQSKLEGQRVTRATRLKSSALLLGKVFNETGERLTPSFAIKQGVRYRYYISTSAMQARDRGASVSLRLPAPALEAAVIDALRSAVEKGAPNEHGSYTGLESGPEPRTVHGTIDRPTAPPAPADSSSAATPARSLIDAFLVRVIVRSDRLEIEHRIDLDQAHPNQSLLVPWTKPASRVRRAILMSSSAIGQSRRMEGEERDRLILAIATARSWLQGLVRGAIHDVAELAARHNRTLRSIRMTLSLAFLDPTLIDAACAGTLPRGYGVTRLMDLPPRFADQWRALGLQRPTRQTAPTQPPDPFAPLNSASGAARNVALQESLSQPSPDRS
ncbi:MAG TPA: hypothetical protein VF886_01965, partial [Roseiarcus sp.]